MNWHRFLISLPFDLFMFLWFLGLGWIGADGKFVKRNVIIAFWGAVAFGVMLILSGCQTNTTVKQSADAGFDSGQQQSEDDDLIYYEYWMESTMEY